MSVTYEDLLLIVENEGTMTLSSVESVVDYLLREDEHPDFEDLEYPNSPRNKLYEISKLFGNQQIKIFGIPDEYHNLAVSFAKANMHEFACEVVSRGLLTKPYSIDLLADFIRYGIFCERHVDCDQCYERLIQIPLNQWNWRAFSFSIDYILDKLNRLGDHVEIEMIRHTALDLADNFIKHIGNDQAFFDKSVVLRSFSEGDINSQKAVLVQGIETLKSAPKCGLRLANILFEEGDYLSAANMIKKCCLNLFKPQQDINGSYCFLLLALSNASALFQKNITDYSNDIELIKSIYRDLHTSLASGLQGIYKDTANTAVKVIASQTSVDYPYDDVDYNYDY